MNSISYAGMQSLWWDMSSGRNTKQKSCLKDQRRDRIAHELPFQDVCLDSKSHFAIKLANMQSHSATGLGPASVIIQRRPINGLPTGTESSATTCLVLFVNDARFLRASLTPWPDGSPRMKFQIAIGPVSSALGRQCPPAPAAVDIASSAFLGD